MATGAEITAGVANQAANEARANRNRLDDLEARVAALEAFLQDMLENP